MKNRLLWTLALLPSLITLIAIQFMADIIPAHYNAAGEINRWGSKYESFIFPAFILLMALFWWLLLKYFKKKQLSGLDTNTAREAASNEKVIYYAAVGSTVLFGIMQCAFMYSAMLESKRSMDTMAIDINLIVNVSLGVLIIIVGNILPKAKRNSVVGVRTPWSMKNDRTWALSNRFGGISFVICGLLIIIESAIIGGITSTFIMLGLIILDGIITTVYSYIVFKKDTTEKT